MKTIKGILGLGVVVVGFYVAWQLMPPYFSNFQFQDAIESEARLSAYSDKSEEAIQDAVFKKARELELPLKKEQIKVQRNGTEVQISTAYTVHVDLPYYPMDLRFTPSTKNARK